MAPQFYRIKEPELKGRETLRDGARQYQPDGSGLTLTNLFIWRTRSRPDRAELRG